MKKLYTVLLIILNSIVFGQTIVKDSLIMDGVKQITLKFDNDVRFDFYYPAEVEFKKVDDRIIGYFNGAAISINQIKKSEFNSSFFDSLLNSEDCTKFNVKCGKLKNNYFQQTLTKKDDILEYLKTNNFLYNGGIICVTWITDIKRDDKVLDTVNKLFEISNMLSEKAELREHYHYFYK